MRPATVRERQHCLLLCHIALISEVPYLGRLTCFGMLLTLQYDTCGRPDLLEPEMVVLPQHRVASAVLCPRPRRKYDRSGAPRWSQASRYAKNS